MYTSITALLVLGLSSFVSGYTLSNVTYASNSTQFQLFPICGAQTARNCPGAWWNDFDPRFTNGVAKMAGDPAAANGYQDINFAFTFKGSAFYV